jgi:hypothetical protein
MPDTPGITGLPVAHGLAVTLRWDLALMGPGAVGLNSDRWFEVNRFDIDVEGVGLPGPLKGERR